VMCLPMYPLAPVMRTFFIVEVSHRAIRTIRMATFELWFGGE